MKCYNASPEGPQIHTSACGVVHFDCMIASRVFAKQFLVHPADDSITYISKSYFLTVVVIVLHLLVRNLSNRAVVIVLHLLVR